MTIRSLLRRVFPPPHTTTYYVAKSEYGSMRPPQRGEWPLPRKGRPGKWKRQIPCDVDVRLCRRQDLIHWLGPVIWEAEADSFCDVSAYPNYTTAPRARLVRRFATWGRQTTRLFAADCAERVLYLAQDERLDSAIYMARKYAFGEINSGALEDAFRAADEAVQDVARMVRKSENPATTKPPALRKFSWNEEALQPYPIDPYYPPYKRKYTLSNIARVAAKASVHAARTDLPDWLVAKDAADLAAKAAAYYAARYLFSSAKWETARLMAKSVMDAEHQWQTDRLFQYLDGEVDLEAMREALETD